VPLFDNYHAWTAGDVAGMTAGMTAGGGRGASAVFGGPCVTPPGSL
jgi:hypothetical protein